MQASPEQTPPSPPSRWSRLAELPALWPGLMLFFALWSLWSARRGSRFDLEWMEGGMLAHAWRLQQGLPLYPEPSADWIPYIYPPGYPALLALLAGGGDLSFALGRAVSLGGTLAAALALVVFAQRQLREPLLGFLGASIFLACYPESGAFYDLVRPDGLGVGLLAWAVVCTLEKRQAVQLVGAVLLMLAFTVKHNLAAFGVPLALVLWARDGWRTALIWGLASAAPALAWLGWMQWSSEGRFWEYLVGVASAHPLKLERAVPGAPVEMSGTLRWTIGAGAIFAGLAGKRAWPNLPEWLPVVVVLLGGWIGGHFGVETPFPPGIGRMDDVAYLAAWRAIGAMLAVVVVAVAQLAVGRRLPWGTAAGLLMLGTAFPLAVLMRGHHGGFINVYIPAHLCCCALLVLGAAGVRQQAEGLAAGLGQAWLRWGLVLVTVFCTAVVPAQDVVRLAEALPVERFTPDGRDEVYAEKVIALLKECDGPIWSPNAAWLPVYAGRAPSMHLIALWDINHREGPFRSSIREITTQIRNGHFACVVDQEHSVGYGVQQGYELKARLKLPRGVLAPRSGWRTQPFSVLVPKAKEGSE